ncbi:MAG: hypothetical protein M4579_003796 [Chaenotheca gracillima]|nr:MAG: hypothetical protein M4579_003796 [Chaenotheca gracillima]
MNGETSESPQDGGSNILGPTPYTTQRLKHATPEHLHITSRRCFIGPIPEGWLKSHRKEWYKHHLHLNYSSRAATFSTTTKFSHVRQISGLEGPSVSAVHGHSFPQPDDVEETDDSFEDGEDEEVDGGKSTSGPAIPVARGVDSNEDSTLQGVVAGSEDPENINTGQELGSKGGSDGGPLNKSSSMSAATQDFKSSRESPERASPSPKGKGGLEIAVDSTEANDSPQTSTGVGRQPSSTLSSKTLPDDSERPSSSVQRTASGQASNSKTSLLQHSKGKSGRDQEVVPKSILSKSPKRGAEDPTAATSAGVPTPTPVATGLVRFNVPHDEASEAHRRKDRQARLSHRRTLRQRRRSKEHDGEIVKVERMLVRVDTTAQSVSDDYDENESMRIETKTIEKWREYIVVCRASSSEEAEYVLQLYKTRVIPDVQSSSNQKQTNHIVPLERKVARVNLYSSLDKTLVLWVPYKRGSKTYLMRPRSSTSSVEWYTFFRTALGEKRSKEVQVSVPDLSLTLKLENPFEKLEAQRDAVWKAAKEADDTAILQTMMEEQAVAGDIIKRCMDMLQGSPEWSDVLNTWNTAEKIGLAWKKYDRLEWVHGANEQKMYGTIAMQKSHDLELRPKLHYPTKAPRSIKSVKSSSFGGTEGDSDDGSARPSFDTQISSRGGENNVDAGGSLIEPPPVEGFLIRLTSQRGRDQRLGRMFYKRLYFSTHDQYLTFCRPAKGSPPPPPKMSMTPKSNIPSAQAILDNMPLIYGVAPFALDEHGNLKWLNNPRQQDQIVHDRDAFDEAERQVNMLLAADGFVDLCNVRKVREVVRGSTPADRHMNQGDQVDFHQDVEDSNQDDGATEVFDDGRTFELVMKNGLIVRLEAYDKETKREWIVRLRDLSKYWQMRKAADLDLLKSVRTINQEKLHIDEELESYLGQFGQKWEVAQSVASAELYNMCGASSCRAITISGTLYRKPRRHSTFKRCSVILCHGELLVFQSSLRKRTGQEIPHAHHERQVAIDLRDCYVYSGLLTEGDLLYQNQTFDSNHPGRHALPRVYPNDGWTSTDEDTTTCFVIWHGRRRSLFRASEDSGSGKQKSRLRSVSRLGIQGKAIVFKTRSRAERDHWVMGISLEIERLQQSEDVRVVSK